MAEADPSVPSEPVIKKGKEAVQGQDGTDTAETPSKNSNYPRGRKGNYNRNWRQKQKPAHVEKNSLGHTSGARPKSGSKPRGRQNAQFQGKTFGEHGQSSQIEGEELKTNVKYCKSKSGSIERTGSSGNANMQGSKENKKAHISNPDNKSRPHSARSQRFQKSKPNLLEDSKLESKFCPASQLSVSPSLPSQPPSLMTTDTQKPFTSHGIVSDGIYVPKNKLDNRRQNLPKKQPTDHQRNLHSSKGYDYSYSVGGGGKKVSVDMGKLTKSFHTVSMRSEGQSSVQASVLIEQLTDEKYECMVCCEVIRCSKAVWNCSNCFHIFHLYCIKKWARSPTAAVEGKSQFDVFCKGVVIYPSLLV